MKKIMRAITIAGAAAIAAVSMLACVGCDTQYPEVTITYEFDGKTYDVEYKLARRGAPQTVQHFIELADAGYYNDTVIHNYEDGGLFIYGGGYTLDENGDLEEKDYWTEVKKLESEKGISFTQSVFTENGHEPLYTVRGEFSANGVQKNEKSYRHNEQGTLVMYYMDKGNDNTRVATVRSDNGETQENDVYSYNSATSMFYTFTGTSRTDLDNKYCAFGRTKDYDQLKALMDAVNEKVQERDENDPFFVEQEIILNQNDYFELVRNAKDTAIYNVPDLPIKIVSVKVVKY